MFRPFPAAFLAALLLCGVPATVPALAATEKHVWRVDSVIASREGGTVRVQVKGAVQSGGWKHARLRLSHGDAHTLEVEFLAQPPAPGAVVITGLMPLAAGATLRAGRGVTAVRVVGEANDVTAQILH